MKQAIVTLLLLLPVCSFSQGRYARQAVVIEYNHESGRHTDIEPVRENSCIVIRYTDVNPFLYKSTLRAEQLNGSYETGAKTFETGKPAAATTPVADQVKALAAVGYTWQLQKTNTAQAKPKKLTAAQQGEVRRLQSDKEIALQAIARIQKVIGSRIVIVNEVMHLDTFIKTARMQAYNTSRKKMTEDINTRTTLSIKEARDIRTIFDNSVADIRDEVNTMEGYIRQLESINRDLSKLVSELDFTDLIDGVKAQHDELETLYTGENYKVLDKNVTLICNNYQTTVSTPFIIMSDTMVSVTGDRIAIKDVAMKKDFGIIKTYGGVRMDFSAGLAATAGDINGWSYTLNKINDSTIYLVTDRQNRRIDLGVVAMMHLYRTRRSNTAWMLTMGVSPDFSTLTSSKVLLGGSFAGFTTNDKDRRFILTAGVALGGADVLKPRYREKSRAEDANFHSFGNISESDLTEKSFQFGVFLGLSYNLGGVGH